MLKIVLFFMSLMISDLSLESVNSSFAGEVKRTHFLTKYHGDGYSYPTALYLDEMNNNIRIGLNKLCGWDNDYQIEAKDCEFKGHPNNFNTSLRYQCDVYYRCLFIDG
jgi:hypothetical protein